VACSAAALIGYVVAWLVGDEAEVANLAVAPEWRGQGVGAALLDAALAEMRRGGAHVAHLEVRDSNMPARALYGSRGFTPVGRRRRYYQAPVEDAVLLRCDLRPTDGAERQSEA
jgi:ribosomal-protein-alanine N-acetyltransferase